MTSFIADEIIGTNHAFNYLLLFIELMASINYQPLTKTAQHIITDITISHHMCQSSISQFNPCSTRFSHPVLLRELKRLIIIAVASEMFTFKLTANSKSCQCSSCHNSMCNNESHSRLLNRYISDITAFLPLRPLFRILALVLVSGQSQDGLSIFIHFEINLCFGIECGRPRDGSVADSMQGMRAAHHYAIRKVKRDDIVRERVAEAVFNNSGRNFWAEIKRIRSNKSGNSRIVDGLDDVCE